MRVDMRRGSGICVRVWDAECGADARKRYVYAEADQGHWTWKRDMRAGMRRGMRSGCTDMGLGCWNLYMDIKRNAGIGAWT
ncbi:MAG: hypothetical protein HFH91_13920 [Lachnospiraceae bacterium]|nr:hypothetical protein [Lachnospiraceae bacterium]